MASKTSATDRIKSLRDSLARGVAALRHLQHSDGHWCAELEGDSILESEYILMKFILGQENEPRFNFGQYKGERFSAITEEASSYYLLAKGEKGLEGR